MNRKNLFVAAIGFIAMTATAQPEPIKPVIIFPVTNLPDGSVNEFHLNDLNTLISVEVDGPDASTGYTWNVKTTDPGILALNNIDTLPGDAKEDKSPDATGGMLGKYRYNFKFTGVEGQSDIRVAHIPPGFGRPPSKMIVHSIIYKKYEGNNVPTELFGKNDIMDMKESKDTLIELQNAKATVWSASQTNKVLKVTVSDISASTGYQWVLEGVNPEILKKIGEDFIGPEKPMPGAPGTRVYKFALTGKEGETTFSLGLKRSFDNNPVDVKFVHKITVVK